MKYPEKSIYTIYSGEVFTVEWYYSKDGKVPGYDFYKTLTSDEKIRFFEIVKYYADSPIGTIMPKKLLNIEDKENKIYALKPYSKRFFCFLIVGKKIVITNGYTKSAQKMTKKDKEKLKVSINSKNDYLIRKKEGVYYEKES